MALRTAFLGRYGSVIGVIGMMFFLTFCRSSKPLPVSEQSNTEVIGEDSTDYSIQTMSTPLLYQSARSRVWDLIHTRLELSFDWENQFVNGVATLELKPYLYAQEDLELDAKGFEIKAVQLVTPDGKRDLQFLYNGNVLVIELDRSYTKGESIQVKIDYVAKPNERLLAGSEAIASDNGLFFINPLGEENGKPQQIWTQGQTQSNSAWFPTIDAPNERCTQEIYMTVENRFKTLSNGQLVYSRENGDGTRTDYWKQDKPHAPYLFMIAVGEFSIVEGGSDPIPIRYWVEPQYEEYAPAIFGNTPEMISFFTELFQYPYPWSKYDQIVVRDYVSGAMENTTASVFMEELQVSNRELLDQNWDYIIAHELVHQWFGDLVTCESWSNLPLNEGFANYGEQLWNEYKYGQDEADYHGWVELQNYLAEAEEKQLPLIRYYYNDREDMFDNHSYAKAGRVLHMLRMYVGDEAFFDALHLYLEENEFSAVEVDHLRLAFEEVTGEDLHWFFDQWFLSPGHPVIEVEHEYSDDSLRVYIVQIQDTLIAPVFKLPLYLDVHTSEEIDRYALLVEEIAEEYAFYYPEEPELVLFDSEQQLLGEVNHPKSASELLYQYSTGEDFLTRFFSLHEIQDTPNDSLKNEVIRQALYDQSWRMRDEALRLVSLDLLSSDQVVVDRVEELLKDEHSDVRSSALLALVDYRPEDYLDEINSALADSSYLVAGTAIDAYLNNTDPELEVIDRFKNESNINLLIPIADYYINQTDTTTFDWFVKALPSLNSQSLYFFLQYFNQYLIIATEEQQLQSIVLLKDLASNHLKHYIRLAAFQGLLLLSDREGVDEILQEIRSKERDPRLVNYYNEF